MNEIDDEANGNEEVNELWMNVLVVVLPDVVGGRETLGEDGDDQLAMFPSPDSSMLSS